MGKVEVIESNAALRNLSSRNGKRGSLRVAAYCRVSTDMEDQKYSYDSQVSYYKSMIARKKGWTFAGVYADEGITGTMTAKRTNFLSMIDECMAGNIDLIVTKSISRFARNTLDVLQYVRRLRDRSVGVFFEEENINTLSMEGEMLLTVLSSVYQQEVENISSHVKKGLQMKMSRGEMVGFHGCLGYDLDKERGTLVVNAKEAEMVKYIFRRYLEGVGTIIISHEIERMGWKTRTGSKKWAPLMIRRILTNEKYTGDLLMGKSFTVDPISHRRLKNNGERKKYLVRDHHPAIIGRKDFDRAQEIMKSRGNKSNKSEGGGYRKNVPKEYTFSGVIECAMCGSVYTRRVAHVHTPYEKVQWDCMNKLQRGKGSCQHSKAVDEEAIKKAFVESYAIICHNNDKVGDELMGYIQTYMKRNDMALKVDKLKKDLEAMRSKRDRLIDMRVDDAIDEIEYKSKYHEISDKIASIEQDYYKAQKILGQGKEGIKKRLEEISKVLEDPKGLSEFNPDVFEAVVERVIVGEKKKDGTIDPYRITFIYKTGFKDGLDGCKFRPGRRSNKPASSDSENISNKETIENNKLSQNQNTEVGDLSTIRNVNIPGGCRAELCRNLRGCEQQFWPSEGGSVGALARDRGKNPAYRPEWRDKILHGRQDHACGNIC